MMELLILIAEKIATQFRFDEAKDIEKASSTIKVECEEIKCNIINAQKEITIMRNRLLTKKSGLIDICTRNKDKDILKELAQTVIDLKHRRQFPDTPIDVIHRIEDELKINLTDSIDMKIIEESKELVSKDYDGYLPKSTTALAKPVTEEKRGIKVITEDEIPNQEKFLEELSASTVNKEVETAKETEEPTPKPVEEPVEETTPETVEETREEEPVEETTEEVAKETTEAETPEEKQEESAPNIQLDEIDDDENPAEVPNAEVTDIVIEPILEPETTTEDENSVKESVQPIETIQIDETQA